MNSTVHVSWTDEDQNHIFIRKHCKMASSKQPMLESMKTNVEVYEDNNPGGPSTVPAPDQATVDKMTKDLKRANISTTGGQRKSIDSCDLLWEKNLSSGKDDAVIRGIDFLLDGAMCLIMSKVEKEPSGELSTLSSEIVSLSLQGKPATMPFPCNFTKPRKISVRHEDRTVAILCLEGKGKYKVYIYTKTQGWDCSSYTIDTQLQNMALGSEGQLVGLQIVNDEYQVVKFKRNGEKQWSAKLSLESHLAPKVKVDNRDRVIISLVGEMKISIYSPDGDLLINIPQAFIKEPSGICTDSQGNIYIADVDNQAIHQFNAQGHFLQTVVKSKIYPTYLAMYEDSYLAVSSFSKLNVVLYKIK